MSYNTPATFRLNAFPSGSFNDLSDSVIQTQLNAAASQIDGALRHCHKLPLNTDGYADELAIIYQAECVMAGFRLMPYIGFKPDINNTNDVVLNNMYEEIVNTENGLLQQIRTGMIIFPCGSDSTPDIVESRPKVFGNPPSSSGLNVDDNGNEYFTF